MRRMLALLIAFFLLPLSAAGESEGFYTQMPLFLQVTQHSQKENLRADVYIQRTYPDTQNDQVDEEIRALVDAMAEKNRDLIPAGAVTVPGYLDVAPVITRTGVSWMSFLTIARVDWEKEQTAVDFDARVFDIETGERLQMTDLFPPNSAAWDMLAEAVREQLSAYFPEESADEDALNALCQRPALEEAAFTLGAARLMLTYRADALYPGKNTLMHAALYYPDIRPLMTERAREQTDNSRFQMVALTYDDGGARAYTMNVLNGLRAGAAGATFFVVGQNMRNNRDVLCRQQDGGYSIQSHSYYHKYPGEFTVEEMFAWKERFSAEFISVTGLGPAMMRAPGGKEQIYVKNAVGLPLIHWTLSSGDAGSDNPSAVSKKVIYNVSDGDVVLMHDLNKNAWRYTASIVESLNNKGFLCVTVEELFADAGISLQADQVYYGANWKETP